MLEPLLPRVLKPLLPGATRGLVAFSSLDNCRLSAGRLNRYPPIAPVLSRIARVITQRILLSQLTGYVLESPVDIRDVVRLEISASGSIGDRLHEANRLVVATPLGKVCHTPLLSVVLDRINEHAVLLRPLHCSSGVAGAACGIHAIGEQHDCLASMNVP